MLQLEKKHLKIVQQILRKYPYQFYAYGSRSKGNATKFSDLDLCYRDSIPRSIIRKIKEEFEKSNLPFHVELVNYYDMTLEFRELIKKNLVKIT